MCTSIYYIIYNNARILKIFIIPNFFEIIFYFFGCLLFQLSKPKLANRRKLYTTMCLYSWYDTFVVQHRHQMWSSELHIEMLLIAVSSMIGYISHLFETIHDGMDLMWRSNTFLSTDSCKIFKSVCCVILEFSQDCCERDCTASISCKFSFHYLFVISTNECKN